MKPVDWPFPRWIAHRGAGKLAPENTLAAFRLGSRHGYRAFECDVKLSRDDVPFLFDALSVRPDGSIVHTARQSLNFSFDCHGAMFTATCCRINGQFMVTVTADLGPVPFSAESMLARRAIQDLVAMGTQQAETQIAITDDQTIRIESTFALLRPVSPVVMLTSITELMLALKPILARLAEILIDATPPVQGTA